MLFVAAEDTGLIPVLVPPWRQAVLETAEPLCCHCVCVTEGTVVTGVFSLLGFLFSWNLVSYNVHIRGSLTPRGWRGSYLVAECHKTGYVDFLIQLCMWFFGGFVLVLPCASLTQQMFFESVCLYVRPLPCRWYVVVMRMIISNLFVKVTLPTSSLLFPALGPAGWFGLYWAPAFGSCQWCWMFFCKGNYSLFC